MKSKIKTILFDLDDTLIDSEQIYIQIYKKMNLEEKDFQTARRMTKEFLEPGHVAARNRLLYFKRYLELRKEYSSKRLMDLNDTYEEELQNLIELDLKKTNQQDVLLSLSMTYQLGIVTNENLRTQILKMRKIDPNQKMFSFIITSEEMGVEKPHQKIIDFAIKRSNHFPQEILMIGDSIKNDLIPFRSKGCHVLGTRQFKDESMGNELMGDELMGDESKRNGSKKTEVIRVEEQGGSTGKNNSKVNWISQLTDLHSILNVENFS